MKNTVLLSVSALLATLFLSLTVGTAAQRNKSEEIPVSSALDIIASHTQVAKAGIVGNEILFTPEDFERALNLSCIDTLTVTKLPDVTEGALYVGSSAVVSGQTLTRATLTHLSFAAATDDVRRSGFDFSVNGSAYSLTCALYLLDGINLSPTTSSAPDASLSVSTYRDIAAYGRLYAYDVEGDRLTYQIVSYPKNGIAVVDGQSGKYVYMPNKGYTGTDSLSYVVQDAYGNYSAAATVKLRVSKNAARTAYDDMEWRDSYAAAILLTDAGIMSGTKVGNVNNFYPDQTVSRVEFLTMAMRAAGIVNLPTADDTGYADDADIPASAKPYVGAASRAGYVKGTEINGRKCFAPNEKISYAEASGLCAAILGLGDDRSLSVSVTDGDVPASARAAVAGGIIDPATVDDWSGELTRADAAKMLAVIYRLF